MRKALIVLVFSTSALAGPSLLYQGATPDQCNKLTDVRAENRGRVSVTSINYEASVGCWVRAEGKDPKGYLKDLKGEIFAKYGLSPAKRR